MMKTFLLIVPFYFIILITDLTENKEIVASSRSIKNNNLFELLNNSTGINLPQFVLLPNIKSENETFEVKYKSFSKVFTRSTSSKWILSVHVDQQFFFNNGHDETLHALCYLQYSVEKLIDDHIYKNASCKITFRFNNISAISYCSLQIGKPPSICSAYFDLSEIDFYNHSPTWASISAELYIPPSETIITSSINQPSFQFNSFNLFNWTVVQAEFFGNLSLGLPMVSIKNGTSFKMPFSITNPDYFKYFEIVIEYNNCLTFYYLENLKRARWEIQNEFKHSGKKQIRFKLHRTIGQIDEFSAKRNQEEIGLLTFNVWKTKSKRKCRIYAAILKGITFYNATVTCYNDEISKEFLKPVTIPIDSNDFTMIAFAEPQIASVKLHSTFSTVKKIYNQVYTYFLNKSSDLYVSQLIKNVTCQSSLISRGIANEGCAPQTFSDSWVVSMQVKQWKAVVFDTFNIWQPEPWKVFLSNSEMNPIVDWFVFRNQKCVALYQSTYLQVGTRIWIGHYEYMKMIFRILVGTVEFLLGRSNIENFRSILLYEFEFGIDFRIKRFYTVNSFGMRTYLGSSSRNLKPWIDISEKMNISDMHIFPIGVLKLSRNKKGTILIEVVANQNETPNLYTPEQLLPDTEFPVVSNPSVSVVKFIGRCISQFDINEVDSHPSSEGRYLNYEIKLKKLQIGEQCHLFLGVVFNDSAEIWLEDISNQDYRLEVNGIEFKNGNLIFYHPQMYVILYGSSLCGNSTVAKGEIDLSSDLRFAKSKENTISTEVSMQTMPIIISTKLLSEIGTTSNSKVEQRQSLSIVIYCVIGVVAIALGILLLNCVIMFNARRNLIANKQRRLSKSGNDERQNKQTKRLNAHKHHQDHYHSLLPPPGPLIPSNEHTTDLVISLQSETGLENSSSLCSQQGGVALSIFGIPMANRSKHSSSCIHQTPQSFNEVIQNDSSNIYTAQSPSP